MFVEREKQEVSSKKPRLALAGSNGHNDRADVTPHAHQRLKQDKMYYLDASKEGNVARFINVRVASFYPSCISPSL